MRLWLTQCYGGRCMMTFLPPVIAEIKGLRSHDGAPVFDAFERVGEPIAVKHMCEGGIKSLFGQMPPYLTPTPIELSAQYITNPQHEVNTNN